MQGGYPAKLKKVLIVTAPLWFKAPFKILRLFVREKLRERVYTVSVPQLTQHIPRSSLPRRLGGDLEVDHPAWLKTCHGQVDGEFNVQPPPSSPHSPTSTIPAMPSAVLMSATSQPTPPHGKSSVFSKFKIYFELYFFFQIYPHKKIILLLVNVVILMWIYGVKKLVLIHRPVHQVVFQMMIHYMGMVLQ